MTENVSPEWWRRAAIYQVYVRSFADGNGDGVGDLAGIRARLPYLHDLGVDAIWFNPWYPSPMADAGYDVSDYRDIDPVFGTLAEAEALIADAHRLGMRIIVDIVPNHCSDEHPWFREAVQAGAGSAARELFWIRDGRGIDGAEPPNNWSSIFGGPAWTRLPDGQWYLHLFAPQQPDFNWDNPKVREEFEDVLRFWFNRGADGVRIDSAAVVVKDPELADFDPDAPPVPHPYTDRDEVHGIYRGWRTVADGYPDRRALIGEIWLPDAERFARYLGPGELHTAFNFDFLACPWDGPTLRACIDATLAVHAPVDAPATWVLSNHDVTRHVTRYGRADTSFEHATRRHLHGRPTDVALGTRRARAAVLLAFALPGSVYVYQGEELGLGEVEDIPIELRQDPIVRRTNGSDPGRDGCRVPLPWSGDDAPFGFSPPDATGEPWLPQPASWRDYTVEAQQGRPDSMLELYRSALHLRRSRPDLGDAPLAWLDAPPGVLAFTRGRPTRDPTAPRWPTRDPTAPRWPTRDPTAPPSAFTCVVNLSPEPVAVPAGTPLLSSHSLPDRLLPPDAAVWLQT